MTHIMFDLETWGTTPGSDIRSIGAVVFDPVTGLVHHYKPNGGTFYVACSNPDNKYPLIRDPETVRWWGDQSAEAQAAFANPVDLVEALRLFGEWLGVVNGGECTNMRDSPLRLWANDPHFDEAILNAAYRAVGLPVPWYYRAPRSMKTVLDLANITREEMKQFAHGTVHNALDDAISQANIVCEGYRRLRLAD